MIKVAGETPSDAGDNKSGNADGEAGVPLEYRNQEGRRLTSEQRCPKPTTRTSFQTMLWLG